MIIDTHTHFNDDKIYPFVDDFISRAKEKNVVAIFNNGDSLNSFSRILDLEKRYPSFCYAVLGIHPEFASESDEYFTKAYQTIKDNRDFIYAIGEIGLDYHYSKDSEYVAKQKKRFIEQIRLAKQLNLPIVIHSRDADFDTLNIIKQELPPKLDLHCYSGSVEILKEYLKLPIETHIGIGGVCTFKNAKTIKEVVSFAPIEVLLTETDAPYLAPTPFRGQVNESSYLPYIIKEIAELKSQDYDEVEELLYIQGKEFYGI